MTNRVVLGDFDGTKVLRISRAGNDVLDPDLPKEGLSFDSRWLVALRFMTSGSFVSGIGTVGMVTVPYPYIPTLIPVLLVLCRWGSSGSYMATFAGTVVNEDMRLAMQLHADRFIAVETTVSITRTVHYWMFDRDQ